MSKGQLDVEGVVAFVKHNGFFGVAVRQVYIFGAGQEDKQKDSPHYKHI